jgi:hypothetical protein
MFDPPAHDSHIRPPAVSRPPARPRPAPAHAELLWLQRRAGNRAVQRIMRGASGLQRSPGDPVAPVAARKVVQMFIVKLASSNRNHMRDIARANEIWQQCGVRIAALGLKSVSDDVLQIMEPRDELNAASSSGQLSSEEIELLTLRPGGLGLLHVYYVPRMTDTLAGYALSPVVHQPPAVVISNHGGPDTLAHEIGHILLADGVHNDADPDNLMASGSKRRVGGDKLSPEECAKALR